MAKTILIPTDFNIESLNTLKLALNGLAYSPVNVVLMCAQELPDSISELLFYSREQTLKKLLTYEFEEALAIIRNRYEGVIGQLSIELFHGRTVSALQQFIVAHRIDTIYLPKKYVLKITKQGFNPIPLIKKARLPFQEIEWGSYPFVVDESQLITLFN